MKLTSQDQEIIIEMYYDACMVRRRRDMTPAQYRVRRQKRHELFQKLLTSKVFYTESDTACDGFPAPEKAS